MSVAEEGRRRGLGRGLSALIGDVAAESAVGTTPAAETRLPVDLLRPSAAQPRRLFDEEKLEELAASIRAHGVLQPILVRPQPGNPGRYEIVAGERRWRAAQRARLHDVPVLVRSVSDSEALELALIENVQRADLNAVEEAMGYRRLLEEFGHTQEALGRLLGKSRSHVANTLRLLTLPEAVLEWLRDGRLTAGHARALVGAPDPLALARRIVSEGLTVRQAETLASGGTDRNRRAKPQSPEKDADTRALEGDLSAALGLRVAIEDRGGQGEVRIRYGTFDQLDALCRQLTGPQSE